MMPVRKFTQYKLRRLEQNLLQFAVAVHTNISPSRLSRIENGFIEPKPDELARIAQALGVAPDILKRSR